MIREILIYISTYIGLFAVAFYTLSWLSRAHEKEPEFPRDPPFVSVVIPAWNEEKGIVRTINSIKDLNYPKDKIEAIVVDDGSKDNTYSIAKKFACKHIHVYQMEKNGGKCNAVNFGISKAKGEIIITMDADNTYVNPDALQYMIPYFNDPKVVCVAPAMAIHDPHGILQRIQQVEYLLGVFLRKAFASMNAIHITPGCFSAYRKWWFLKYGGFRSAHLTEDLEMALRIQTNHYKIQNALKANVYTVGPNNFRALLTQRKRWYTGLLRNLRDYRHLFSKKYGPMGIVVLPVALTTVVLSVFLTSYVLATSVINLKKDISLWSSINFDLFSTIKWNEYFLSRYFFYVFSNPITIFVGMFICVLIAYMFFAKRQVKEYTNIKFSIIFFLIFYSFLFAFWWMISFFYTIFNKSVSWR